MIPADKIGWLTSEPEDGVCAKLVDGTGPSHGWVVLAREPINGPQLAVHFVITNSHSGADVGDGEGLALGIAELAALAFDMIPCEVLFLPDLPRIAHRKSELTPDGYICYRNTNALSGFLA